MNTDSVAGTFADITLPQGSFWRMVADVNQVNHIEGISGHAYSNLIGGRNYSFNMEPASVYIWIKE
jgi:hypothetical protein